MFATQHHLLLLFYLCVLLFCQFCMVITTDIPHEEYYQGWKYSARPPPNERKFVSPVIDAEIQSLSAQIKDPLLAELFTNCWPNTLDTTIANFTVTNGVPDTFVVTGDIPAMWLRDSFNQVFSYLPFATKDPKLQQMLLGVLYRQAKSVNLDSYANAFNYGDTGSPWQGDTRIPPMTKWLWEGKYELDSLAAFLQYSYYYYYYTNDATPYKSSVWVSAVQKAVQTIQAQQKGTAQDQPPAYFFQRLTTAPTDTLMHGVGVPAANNTGMSKSPFRPSDDAHTLPYPIAANAMAATALKQVATLFEGPANNSSYAKTLIELAGVIAAGIKQYGIINHPVYGAIYAYEVDGYGNSYFMDDANIPSVLSLPYLGWCDKNDSLYANTRKYLLSPANPYYFSGAAASGIGGPHIGYGYIWPLAIIMQAQTSTDPNEIKQCLEWLKTSSAGTGFMHESFWKDDATKFTRPWFAWANTQFGHLILTIAAEYPDILFK